jgi:hypothetical protein
VWASARTCLRGMKNDDEVGLGHSVEAQRRVGVVREPVRPHVAAILHAGHDRDIHEVKRQCRARKS